MAKNRWYTEPGHRGMQYYAVLSIDHSQHLQGSVKKSTMCDLDERAIHPPLTLSGGAVANTKTTSHTIFSTLTLKDLSLHLVFQPATGDSLHVQKGLHAPFRGGAPRGAGPPMLASAPLSWPGRPSAACHVAGRAATEAAPDGPAF